MADVPDLGDLPMDISETEEEFYANDIPNKLKADKYSHGHEKRVTCLPKIKLEIRKPEKSAHVFKKVIALATVVKKLKESRRLSSQNFFYDDDLLTPALVNEKVVVNNVNVEEAPSTRFTPAGTSQHNIRDSKMKALKMEGKDSIVTLYLEGENVKLELKINVDTYLEARPDGNKLPVTLGIVGYNLYLCCTAEEGTTTGVLRLIEVNDIKSKKDDELLPFIFFRRPSSNNDFTFESAAFPGYYLSSCQKENEKLQIRPDDNTFLIDFSV